MTLDKFVIARRTRQVPRLELIAAVLIAYPRYIDYRKGFSISAEQALEHIILTTNSRRGGITESKLKVGHILRKLQSLTILSAAYATVCGLNTWIEK